MKFNPYTNELFTDKKELIKKLYCPFKLDWQKLKSNNSFSKKCSICSNTIIDTNSLSDEKAKKLLENKPDTCLKISFNQKNIEIISDGKKY